MTKRITLAAVGLAAAAGAASAAFPNETRRYATATTDLAGRAWDGVAANPTPVVLALGTFLLTVGYHKARGKSLRESVEVAATRVAVVPVPGPAPAEHEPAVVRRAKARATRTQLLADQVGLENRLRKLPEAVLKAEKEACYTEQGVADAGRALAEKKAAHAAAVASLDGLRKEQAAGQAELHAIAAELKRLADVV